MKSSEIGGQAVIEGIMMRNGDEYAVAVRKPDGEIHVKTERYEGISGKCGILSKIPFIRGIFKFVDSMVLGIRTLMYSAEFFEEDEEEQKKGADSKKNRRKKKTGWAMRGMLAFSLVFVVVIFMMVPYFLSSLFKNVIPSYEIRTLLEGSGMDSDIYFISGTDFQNGRYTARSCIMGAEHKCINCIEHGMELNVENVRKSSRQHKRCGTSFLFLVLAISIILLLLIHVDSMGMRVVVRLLLLPVIAGISYEILHLAGDSDGALINLVSKPGLAIQKLTTKEPDDSMIEVAIQAVEAVFDWRDYERKNF